jgi:radical SAM superfamily enzyme YgiQ (UPF0313 family)
MGKMRLLFIAPPIGKMASKYLAPPLGIGILAGLTPKHYEIKFIDGNIESVDILEGWDIVAITVSTPAAQAAFEIAKQYQKTGALIVMGGMHPTVMPEECLTYADVIFIGESEVTWGEFLKDFEEGSYRSVYKAETEMNPLKIPRISREIFSKRGYLVTKTVLMSRGCPNSCEFCLVKKIYGPTYRTREIAEIIEEIRSFPKGGMPVIVFVDDNIVGNREFAKEFFKTLIPLKIKWFSQCSISIANDDELLDLAKKSGCIGLFIGFESIDENNLISNRKNVNKTSSFIEQIKKIRKKKIIVHGAFIFGFENDNTEVFDKTLKFTRNAKLDVANFGILVPYPGTPLYEQYSLENRIFDYQWKNYDAAHVVFTPHNMKPMELQQGQYYAMRKFYSWKNILLRILSNPSPLNIILNLSQINVVKELKKIVQESSFN